MTHLGAMWDTCTFELELPLTSFIMPWMTWNIALYVDESDAFVAMDGVQVMSIDVASLYQLHPQTDFVGINMTRW